MYRQYDPKILRKLQLKELEVLKAFIDICKENSINYFAVFGTTIGAVRHNGFIPWDDDMDFGMLRSDYNKLLSVMENMKDSKYKVIGPDSDEKFYNFIPHFCDSTTRFATQYDHGNFNMGIGFDIFVYDLVPDNIEDFEKIIKKVTILRSLYMVYNVNFYKNSVFKKGKFVQRVIAGASHYLVRIIPGFEKIVYNTYLKTVSSIQSKGDKVTQYSDSMSKESVISMDELYPLVQLPFEDIDINVPNQYKKILTRVYGDYMKLPPLDKRQNHYPFLLDLGDGMIIKGDE